MTSYQGECSCGWRGQRRLANTAAREDVQAHCLETGCTAPADDWRVPLVHGDDLMPHERRVLRLREQGQNP